VSDRAGALGVLPSGAGIGETAFKTAMRQVASSVAIIAAAQGRRRNGLTATAICSVSAAPPTLLVCVSREASATVLIEESAAFAVNFLASSQHGVARLFSTAKLAPEARFAEGTWTTLETGSPMLEGTVASFDCRVESRVMSGTHNIYIGRVAGAVSLEQDVLLYRDGLFRRLEAVG
jgi:flavin reductase